MSITFDEIMKYHSDNPRVFNEIKSNLSSLVPFIGAGLSAFAYGTWPRALKELASKITDKDNRESITELIDKGDYLIAAQKLEESLTPTVLLRNIGFLFCREKLEKERSNLASQSIYLLPKLFKNRFIITTNLDETLETVYSDVEQSFDDITYPGHTEAINMLRTGVGHGLFKLHGTVKGSHGMLTEWENLVFTESQYDKHYKDSSKLVQALKECLSTNMIFFLGCSLQQDRTVQVIKEVMNSDPGIPRYTIIGCDESERDDKIRELGNHGIQAILYRVDKDGNDPKQHEAVRVILEHLLELADPGCYRNLSVHVGQLKNSNVSRFDYRSGTVPFVGRSNELNALKEFLTADEGTGFQWWAIVGPGGCGKSRLAYELVTDHPPGWCCRFLKSEDYNDLSYITNASEKTLLVADYVQEHAAELGELIEILSNRSFGRPLRLLLIERDTIIKGNQMLNTETYSWVEQLYSCVNHIGQLKATCYKPEDRKVISFSDCFLKLKNIGHDDLVYMLTNYDPCKVSQKINSGRRVDESIAKALLNKLKDIDPDLSRPLYALFLADAYLAGTQATQWNTEDMLGYIIEREFSRLRSTIRGVMDIRGADRRLEAACKYLLCVATVLQDCSLTELQELCPKQFEILREKASSFESPENLLTAIGVSDNSKIILSQPNLVSEYFVYHWMLKSSTSSENVIRLREFIQTVWKHPRSALAFFVRMLNDYAHLLNKKPDAWTLFLPDLLQDNEDIFPYYAQFLQVALYCCDSYEQCVIMIDELETLVTATTDAKRKDQIIIELCNGLVNLSAKPNKKSADMGVNKLKTLVKVYQADPLATGIMLSYTEAITVYSCIHELNEQDYAVIIRLTEAFISRNSKNQKMISEFDADKLAQVKFYTGNCLFNLGIRKSKAKRDEIWSDLINFARKVVTTDADTRAIVRHAKRLFERNALHNQNEAKSTIYWYEKLLNEHPEANDVPMFAQILAGIKDVWSDLFAV